MGKKTCKAKEAGIVKTRGNPTIEWYKNGEPQYYCRGWIDSMTDEPFEVCRNCFDFVERAESDFQKWQCLNIN